MGRPCVWRSPSVPGAGIEYCDHHCGCHCGNADLYRDRVDPKEEMVGLDASQHGENAYPSFNGFD